MNQQEPMDQLVRNWLAAAAPEAPPIDLHSQAMDRVAGARQKRWPSNIGAGLLGRRQALAFAMAFAALTAVAVAALVFFRGGLIIGPGSTPLVPVVTPTATPALTATPAPSPEPVHSVRVNDFAVPFEYLVPESVNIEGERITSDVYRLFAPVSGIRPELIIARIDGAHADDCPRSMSGTGGVELPFGVDAILETLGTAGGMSFSRQETGLMRSGLSATEIATTAECLDHIHFGNAIGPGGTTLALTRSSSKTWLVDVGDATIAIQAWPADADDSDGWLSTANNLAGSIVFLDDLRPSPSANPSAGPSISRSEFDSYLIGYGQLFTPEAPPNDAVQPSSADLARLSALLGNPSATTYGIVTCVNEAFNCAERGLVRPGESLPLWLVEFPAVTGCPAWFTFDARSGAEINGTGPPC